MTTNRQECGLKNESQSNCQKIKLSRSKNSRAQRDNCPPNCGQKTKRRNDEKLSIHQKRDSKIAISAWQSGVCLRARKKISKTGLHHEHQTSYYRNCCRLCRSLRLVCAIGYGLLMGLFSGVWAIIMYVVIPMPCSIACKWFFAGIAQSVLIGVVTFYVYKPKASAT